MRTTARIDEIIAVGLERRRRAWTAYRKGWLQMGRRAPEVGVVNRSRADVGHMSLKPHFRGLMESLRLRTARSRRQAVKRARWTGFWEGYSRRARRAARKHLGR